MATGEPFKEPNHMQLEILFQATVDVGRNLVSVDDVRAPIRLDIKDDITEFRTRMESKLYSSDFLLQIVIHAKALS